MGERSRGGLCRPCLCAGRPGNRPFSAHAVGFLTLLVCLGMPLFFLDGLCPLLGPAARMGGPVNQVLYLPSGFLQGRCSGLFHLIHRLGVSGGLLSVCVLPVPYGIWRLFGGGCSAGAVRCISP